MGWRNWLRWLLRGYWIEEYPNGFAVKSNCVPSDRMARRMKAAFEREARRRDAARQEEGE